MNSSSNSSGSDTDEVENVDESSADTPSTCTGQPMRKIRTRQSNQQYFSNVPSLSAVSSPQNKRASDKKMNVQDQPKKNEVVVTDSESEGIDEEYEDERNDEEFEDEKKFRCRHADCKSRFKRKYHLKIHIERKHSDSVLKYRCPINNCDATVGEIPWLRYHFRRFHENVKCNITKKGIHFYFNGKAIETIQFKREELNNGRFYGETGSSRRNNSDEDEEVDVVQRITRKRSRRLLYDSDDSQSCNEGKNFL